MHRRMSGEVAVPKINDVVGTTTFTFVPIRLTASIACVIARLHERVLAIIFEGMKGFNSGFSMGVLRADDTISNH